MEDKNSKSTNEVDTKDFKTDADRIRVQQASMSIYPEPTKISYAKTQEEIDKQAPVPDGDNSDLITFNYVKWMHIACWSLFLVLPIMLDTVAFLVEICFIPINSVFSRAGDYLEIVKGFCKWIALLLPYIPLVRAMFAHRQMTLNNVKNKTINDKIVIVGMVSSIAAVISIFTIKTLLAQ